MTTSLTSAAPPPVETKRTAAAPPRRPRSRTSRYAIWFVGPFVVLFVGMYVAPILFALYKSYLPVAFGAAIFLPVVGPIILSQIG